MGYSYFFNFTSYMHEMEIYELNNNIEGLIINSQIVVKLSILMVYKQNFLKLTTTSKHLWEMIEFSDENRQRKITTATKWAKLQIEIYFMSMVFSGGGYAPDTPILFVFSLAVQLVMAYLVLFVVVGLDACFAALCISFVLQFDVLNDKLRKVQSEDLTKRGDEEVIRRLKDLIQVHQKLLSSAKLMRDLFSVFFLAQITMSTGTICIESYLVFERTICHTPTDKLNLPETIKGLFAIIVATLQLMFYCIPANELTERSLDVSSAVFECSWYKRKKSSFHDHVRFVIMRANKPVYITAGGMLDINRAALTFVFKTALSFLAFVRSVKK